MEHPQVKLRGVSWLQPFIEHVIKLSQGFMEYCEKIESLTSGMLAPLPTTPTWNPTPVHDHYSDVLFPRRRS